MDSVSSTLKTVEFVSRLDQNLLCHYIASLVKLALDLDPDARDTAKLGRVVADLMRYNNDPSTEFLILFDADESVRGICTFFVRDKYVNIAQVASNSDVYEDVSAIAFDHAKRRYHGRAIYGFLRTSIAPAVRVYERVGAIEVDGDIDEELKRRTGFKIMRINPE